MAGYLDPNVHQVMKGDSESSINQQNQYMRSQPWYQQYLASVGQNPANVHLNDAQRLQVTRLAQQNGFKVDEGAIEVDPAGNFNPRGHKLRNTLIAAGAAAGGYFAAPYLASALGGVGGGSAGGAVGAAAPEIAVSSAPMGAVSIPTAAGVMSGAAGTATGTGGAASAMGYLAKGAKIAKAAAPILSQAAGSRANAQVLNDQQRLNNAKFALEAPQQRMKNAAQANLMANVQPWKTNWAGPGSGMKPGGGYTGATGGYGDPNLMSPDLRALGQRILHEQIQAQLQGQDQLPDPGHSSAVDKILGYGAMGASVLGGMR